MAFKRLSVEDMTKLELVKDVSVEELTELITNKDNFLKKTVNIEEMLNSNGEAGTFTYTNKEGEEVVVRVPLLSIVPIPSIPIDAVKSFGDFND